MCHDEKHAELVSQENERWIDSGESEEKSTAVSCCTPVGALCVRERAVYVLSTLRRGDGISV